jgi:transcriptional regulator with XRE-family HTH domain
MEFALLSPNELADELGRRVRAERLRLNWTQQTLAKRAGVSRWTVTRMESGEPVSLPNFLAVVAAMHRSADLDQLLRPAPPLTIEQFVTPTTSPRKRGRR